MVAATELWATLCYMQALHNGQYPLAHRMIDKWFEQCERVLNATAIEIRRHANNQ